MWVDPVTPRERRREDALEEEVSDDGRGRVHGGGSRCGEVGWRGGDGGGRAEGRVLHPRSALHFFRVLHGVSKHNFCCAVRNSDTIYDVRLFFVLDDCFCIDADRRRYSYACNVPLFHHDQ